MSKIKNALIVGASRGLGFAIVAELLLRGSRVTATIRGDVNRELRQLSERYKNQLEFEKVDITVPQQILNLKTRLQNQTFDLIFVNAGISSKNGMSETMVVAEQDDFVSTMLTNAFAPMKLLEALVNLVPAGGVLGAMSSGQGSIAGNESGANDIYRASKAALNMLMKSFSIRQREHSIILLAPGWVQTELGGSGAKFTVSEVTPDLVNALEAQVGQLGLHFVDRFNKAVSW